MYLTLYRPNCQFRMLRSGDGPVWTRGFAVGLSTYRTCYRLLRELLIRTSPKATKVAGVRAPILSRVVAMTDTRTMVAHLVADDAAAAGRHTGRYVGVCGAVVLPGSLTEDASRYCRSCQDWAAQ